MKDYCLLVPFRSVWHGKGHKRICKLRDTTGNYYDVELLYFWFNKGWHKYNNGQESAFHKDEYHITKTYTKDELILKYPDLFL